jgi:hypothetical protein
MCAIADGTEPGERPNENRRVLDRLARLGLLHRERGRLAFAEPYRTALAEALRP